jgi:hypothetical protein
VGQSVDGCHAGIVVVIVVVWRHGLSGAWLNDVDRVGG